MLRDLARRAVAGACALEPSVTADHGARSRATLGTSSTWRSSTATTAEHAWRNPGRQLGRARPGPGGVAVARRDRPLQIRKHRPTGPALHRPVVLESGDAFVFGGPARALLPRGSAGIFADAGDPTLGIDWHPPQRDHPAVRVWTEQHAPASRHRVRRRGTVGVPFHYLPPVPAGLLSVVMPTHNRPGSAHPRRPESVLSPDPRPRWSW